MNYKVYTLANPLTGEIKYVGMTKRSLLYRLGGHLARHSKNKLKSTWIDDLFKTTGLTPKIEELETVNTKEEALKIEQFYIVLLQYYGFELLNLTHLNYNSPKGKVVYQFDLQGNFIRVWPSATRAEQFYSIQNIAACATGTNWGRYSAGSFLWSYIPIKPRRLKGTSSKQVFQYGLDGTYIRTYVSARKAEESGFNYRNISACCLGEKKSHLNYQWSYFKTSNIGPYKYKVKNNKIKI